MRSKIAFAAFLYASCAYADGPLSEPARGLSVASVVINSPIASVKDQAYGATGDGSTNDTIAIQAAIDAGHTAYVSTGAQQSVFVPQGVYLVSKAAAGSWALSISSGVKLFGPGTVKLANSQIAQVRVFRIEDTNDVTVDGITVNGNATNQTSEPVDPKKHAFFTRGNVNLTLRNIKAIDIDGDAFYFGESSGSVPQGLAQTVDGFYVDGTRRSLVTITGASNVTIRNGYGKAWSKQQSAALNSENDGDASANVIFDNIYVESPSATQESPHTSYAVTLSNATNTKITNCVLNAGISGVRTVDLLIAGNTINNPGVTTSGYYTAGSSGIVLRYTNARAHVIDNQITVGGTTDGVFHVAAIDVTHTGGENPKDVIISRNRLFPKGTGLYGVYMEQLDGTTIVSDNVVDDTLGSAGANYGIGAYTQSAGFQDLIVANNTIRDAGNASNAVGAIDFYDQTSTGFRSIAIRGNKIVDDQGSPTTTAAVRFREVSTGSFGDVVIDGNSFTSNITSDVAGLAYWRTGGTYDGTVATRGDFEGTGTPTTNAITAKAGSTYRRRDGGAGTSFYVKESSTGSSNWVAK